MVDKVCSMYFSGTGTTEKIVRFLGEKISNALDVPCEFFDFTPLSVREMGKNYGKCDLVILGVPVIAGRVPNLLLKYLDSVTADGALAVPIVLFGNRNFDDALIELNCIMLKNDFITIAGGAFVGEHSFSDTLGKGRPDVDDMKEAAVFAEKIVKLVEQISQKKDYREYEGIEQQNKEKIGKLIVKGQEPIRPYYTPRDRNGNGIDIRKVKPKTNDNCTNCGICANLCPLGSISHNDYNEIIGICMKCCACVKKCPVGAKYFDDQGYLYHKSELEEMYGKTRAENEIFLVEFAQQI